MCFAEHLFAKIYLSNVWTERSMSRPFQSRVHVRNLCRISKLQCFQNALLVLRFLSELQSDLEYIRAGEEQDTLQFQWEYYAVNDGTKGLDDAER